MENQEILHHQVILTNHGAKSVEDLQEQLGLQSKEDVINYSLAVLQWAVQKSVEGDEVGSVNKDNNIFCKLNMKILNNLHPVKKSKENE
ncbi:hypothetical protein ACTOJ1_000082 [Shigella flexneri]